MTFSASDVSINPNVRCDPGMGISSSNWKKTSDLLKEVGDQLNGQTLEDIINNIVGALTTELHWQRFWQQAQQVLSSSFSSGANVDIDETILSSWGVHAGTEYIAGERFQLESDGITLTDMTGGPPYILSIGGFSQINFVRDCAGVGEIRLMQRASSAGVYSQESSLRLSFPFNAPDAPLAAGAAGEFADATMTRHRIYDTAAGNQLKLVMALDHGTNPPTAFAFSLGSIELFYYA
jgi:hypothetical protein